MSPVWAHTAPSLRTFIKCNLKMSLSLSQWSPHTPLASLAPACQLRLLITSLLSSLIRLNPVFVSLLVY